MQFAASMDEVTDWVRAGADGGTDVYFSMASFRERGSGKADNIHQVQALWLDLDVGEGKPFATLDAAQRTIDSLSPLGPPSATVGSGGGLHVYWKLDRPLSVAEWKPLAAWLKRECQLRSIQADHVRTEDAASILRVDGTSNWKSGVARPVQLLHNTGRVVAVDDIPQLAVPAFTPGQSTAPGDDEFDSITMDYPPVDSAWVATRCGHIRHMRDTQGEGPEPWWRACLSVVTRCIGGAELIHQWSQGDTRYNPVETERKARGTRGPALCSSLNTLRPELCAGCQEECSSPILLGGPLVRRVAAIREEVAVTQEAPEIEMPRFRVSQGKTWWREDSTSPWKPMILCAMWLDEVMVRERATHEADMSYLTVLWQLPGQPIRGAPITQSELFEPRMLNKWLADHNLRALLVARPQELQMYISELIRQHTTEAQVKTYYDRLGWVDRGFVLGPKLFTADGKVIPAKVRTDSPVMRMSAKGDLAAWKQAAELFGAPGMEYQAFAVLACFGSPILKIVNSRCAVLSLCNQSGAGKTVSARFGLSIYGDPELLGQNAVSTFQFVERSLGVQNNVPHYLDEASSLPAKVLAEYIYMAANGEGRNFLTPGREIREARNWCLVPMLSTNIPLLDLRDAVVREPHRLRVLELPFFSTMDPTTGEAIHRAALNHYGTAAEVYLPILAMLRTHLPQLWEGVGKEIDGWTGLSGQARFVRWLLMAAKLGGDLAKSVGLIDWDVERIVRAAHTVACGNLKQTRSEDDRFLEILAEMTVLERQKICVWDKGCTPLISPTSTIARYDRSERALYVMTRWLREKCIAENIAWTQVKVWLAQQGVVRASVRLAPGAMGVSALRFDVDRLGISLDDAEEDERGMR